MSKKKGNFVEQHVDKLILAVIGLICLGLLWIYVFSNPFGPVIGGRKESLSSLQSRLEQKKDQIRKKIDEIKPGAPVAATDFIAGYEQMLVCSIPKIDASIYPLTPGIGSQAIGSDREYAVPEIPALQDVKIAYIRGAVYLPTEEVTPEMPYASVETKIGDLDFVTVSARLDVKRLVQQFESSFMGLGVNASHKDRGLATPVAARIELQRRVKGADGTWSEWGPVAIPQTVAYRKTFEKLPMISEDLGGGGVHVLVAQYKDLFRQISLLQPPPYDFASTRYQYWMPPQYLEEVQKLLQQQEDEAKRQKRETAAAAGAAGGPMGPGLAGEMGPGGRATRPIQARPTRPDTGRGRDQRTGPDRGVPGEIGPGGLPTERPGRPGVRPRTIEDVYRDYQKEILTGDWWTRNEPILIWAHDDTIQPGKTYQYRIRAGLFNPIAGRDWFRPDQQEYKNQVILWSPFAQADSAKKDAMTVAVPKMLHIFPMDISKNNPDAVLVTVAKYYYGRWRSEDFEVLPGQMIGSVVEPKKSTASVAAGETGAGPGMAMEGAGMPGMMGPGFGMGGVGPTGAVQTAATIDFTTDSLFLDIIGAVDWSGALTALRRREYNDMLYTVDGIRIDKLPIRQQNWPPDVRKEYRDVKEAEKELENETLVGRTPSGSMQTPGVPGMPMGPGGRMPPMGGFGREGMMEW